MQLENKWVIQLTMARQDRVLIYFCPTVIDYDRVLVLKDGTVVENDSPAALITNDKSEFKKLCMADGPIEYQQLLAMARSTKNNRA